VGERVQWRHGNEIGLAFSEVGHAHSAPPQSNELAQRVSQLETEIASLRRALKRLKSEIESGSDSDAA